MKETRRKLFIQDIFRQITRKEQIALKQLLLFRPHIQSSAPDTTPPSRCLEDTAGLPLGKA
ncbi:hypothetical protein E2C01_100152 [Portunus trituberculatus]|uniref:Uncharacterized protein n=1 Tax=Portunus trituberculatus TaxID=210409 RepID=A0A5B7K600_PORTR|nr:hypothetical protein [Portunus trituberculatus]